MDSRYYEQIGSETVCIDEKLPFAIPNSWKWIRLSAIAEFVSGVSYQKQDIVHNGIRILRGGNIQDEAIVTNEDDVFLPRKYTDSKNEIKTGDVVIVASTGSTIAIGRPGFAINNMPSVQIGAFLRIVRPYSEDMIMIIKTIFQSNYYRDSIRAAVKGTNIGNIKTEYITELFVPIPPLAEQMRLMTVIEKLLATIQIGRTVNLH